MKLGAICIIFIITTCVFAQECTDPNAVACLQFSNSQISTICKTITETCITNLPQTISYNYSNFYINTTSGICQQCPDPLAMSCAMIDGQVRSTACKPTYCMQNTNSDQIWWSNPSYYINSTGYCQTCPDQLGTQSCAWNGTQVLAQSCNEGYYLNEQQQCDGCPGYFAKSCFLNGTQVVVDCMIGTYLDQNLKTCQDCSDEYAVTCYFNGTQQVSTECLQYKSTNAVGNNTNCPPYYAVDQQIGKCYLYNLNEDCTGPLYPTINTNQTQFQ